MEFYAQLLTPEMRPVFLTAIFLLGSCIGSFLNVCIWRMPLNQSVVFAPSHCTSCQKPIKWFDNIPLLSYLILRGRCRHCKTHYTMRYFWIELLTGVIFLSIGAVTPIESYYSLPIALTAAAVVITAGVIDFEHGIIPNKLNYFLFVTAIIYAGLFGIFSPFSLQIETGIKGAIIALITAIIYGSFLSLFTLISNQLTKRTAFGWGDVKLLTALAAGFGVLAILQITIFASIMGVVFALITASIKRKSLLFSSVKFGVFIGLATLMHIFIENLERYL